MAANAVAAAPTADAEGQPAQPDPGELRLAETPTPLTNEPTAPNSDVRIAQLTEKLAKLMTTLGEKTEAAAAAKIAAEKTKAAAATAIAETAALEDELTELFSELQTDAEHFATEQGLLGLSLDDNGEAAAEEEKFWAGIHSAAPPDEFGDPAEREADARALQAEMPWEADPDRQLALLAAAAARSDVPNADRQAHTRLADAATLINAAARGHLARLAYRDAGALFGTLLARQGVCLRRILGGPHAYDLVLCKRGPGLALPFHNSEVLALLSHNPQGCPGAPNAAFTDPGSEPMHTTSLSSALSRPLRNGLAWLNSKLDNKGLLDASQGKAKGAAARKAAAKAAQAKLRAALEAALEAKNRVVLVHGVLYYAGSRALEDADEADSWYAEPKADAHGVCRQVDVRWLHPSIPKADVEHAFAPFGPIQYVWLRSGQPWMDPPVVKGRLGDFEYNYATVIFLNKPDATAACEALNGAALLGSEALMVRYATNTRADDMSDDDDDNNDDGDSDAHGSDGMEDDEFDADDFI